jgi:hypothetical protein
VTPEVLEQLRAEPGYNVQHSIRAAIVEGPEALPAAEIPLGLPG